MACTYEGKSYSEGSHKCQEGRVMVCLGETWSDTGRNCSGSPTIDVPERESGDGLENIEPWTPPRDGPELREFTNYSLKRDVYTHDNQIYGRWSPSVSIACDNNLPENSIPLAAVTEGPVDAGMCKGNQRLLKIKNIL